MPVQTRTRVGTILGLTRNALKLFRARRVLGVAKQDASSLLRRHRLGALTGGGPPPTATVRFMDRRPAAEPVRQTAPEVRIAEIRDRCRRATPGPWAHFADGYVERAGDPGETIGVTCARRPDNGDPLPAPANAEFVAHARDDVPWLLDELERLRRALGRIADGEPDDPREVARQALRSTRRDAPTLC